MNEREIFESINKFEQDAGEDFLDYFDSNINCVNYMFWALGKGYLSQEKFNLWEEAMNNKKWDADSASTCVYDSDAYKGVENSFAVVSSVEWEEEAQDKAYMYLAEFISESIIYQKRLKTFLEDDCED